MNKNDLSFENNDLLYDKYAPLKIFLGFEFICTIK